MTRMISVIVLVIWRSAEICGAHPSGALIGFGIVRPANLSTPCQCSLSALRIPPVEQRPASSACRIFTAQCCQTITAESRRQHQFVGACAVLGEDVQQLA